MNKQMNCTLTSSMGGVWVPGLPTSEMHEDAKYNKWVALFTL
jgi:hypothetical protein